MMLIKYDHRGDSDGTVEFTFASAAALAQSLPLGDAVQVGENAFWMHDTQRLEENPPIERIPSGWRAAVARANNLDAIAMLPSLAKDPDVYVRWRVANNECTPPEVREALAKEGILPKSSKQSISGSLRRIGESSCAPVSALVQLSLDPEWDVRCGPGGNKNTPAHIIARLMNDQEATVRRCVSENESASVDVLEVLSRDPDGNVRCGVVSNRNTPAHILVRLASDPELRVRYCVARDARTPTSTLLNLSVDPEEVVRDAAKENMGQREGLAGDEP